MNDFEKATKNIGNIFDMVLIASHRMREIHRKRNEQEKLKIIDTAARKNKTVPAVQAIKDIETGLVGREYLKFFIKPKIKQKPQFY